MARTNPRRDRECLFIRLVAAGTPYSHAAVAAGYNYFSGSKLAKRLQVEIDRRQRALARQRYLSNRDAAKLIDQVLALER